MPTSVDIVITTRNRPVYAAEAIASAIDQTEPAANIIVVDDGSDHPIEQQIEPKLAKHCTFIRNEISAGVSAARNKGSGASSGDWVVFVDDDDWLSGTYIKELKHFIEAYESALDFCWPSRTLVYETTGQHATKHAPPPKPTLTGHDDEDLNSLMETGCSGTAFKASTLETIGGFDETLVMSEDRDLTFRLLTAGYLGRPVSASRIFIRIHEGERLSTSAKNNAQAKSDIQVLSNNLEFLKQHPVLAEKYIGRVAKRLWERGYRKEAIHAINLLCRIRPFSIRARKRQVSWRLSVLIGAGSLKVNV